MSFGLKILGHTQKFIAEAEKRATTDEERA